MKRTLLLLSALSLGAISAFAADGQILINQSAAIAAGGFPYTITQPGSYKLSGNLTAPLNTAAILVYASNVSIELNGFTVGCSYDQTFSGSAVCVVFAQGSNRTLRNGFVTVSANSIAQYTVLIGVNMALSTGNTIEYVNASAPNLSGATSIQFGDHTIFRFNVASGAGPYLGCPSLIEGNVNLSGKIFDPGSCVLVNNVGAW